MSSGTWHVDFGISEMFCLCLHAPHGLTMQMHSSVFAAQQGASTPVTTETQSASDIVLNPDVYSALLAANTNSDKGGPVEPSNARMQAGSRPTMPYRHPATSITDLVLDNITYDKILSSSARGLSLASDQQHPPPTPPFGDDARTPPNSPTNALSNQSLMGASFNIMARETITQSDIDKTNF
ncbi:hypothetical protein C0995_006844 [Termitomyces sp. Mi166|nr:hypothetical protein C0995_006844 [Termitomyces sp. Mi166\